MCKSQNDFQEIINEILKYQPNLTASGLNYHIWLSPDKLLYDAQMLRAREAEFWICVHSLIYLCSLKSNEYFSYSLKHVIEKENHTHIYNGTLIAAAIYLGLKLKRFHGYKKSPNAIIVTQKLMEIPEVRNV